MNANVDNTMQIVSMKGKLPLRVLALPKESRVVELPRTQLAFRTFQPRHSPRKVQSVHKLKVRTVKKG